jgi:hypothetical protein
MLAGSSMFSGTQACERRIQSDDWEMEAHAKVQWKETVLEHLKGYDLGYFEIGNGDTASWGRGEESRGTVIEKGYTHCKGRITFIHSFVHSFSRQC